MSKKRIRLFVTGKVQGVFFRQTLKVMAKKNDVFGWVKNLEDGRVEAVLEGEEDKVDRLVEWAHGGPANARVEDVNIRNEKFTSEFLTFDVSY
jgi:acylphosphatase